MHYFGGKFRLAKEIATVLEAERTPDMVYLEPFCGACSVVAQMSGIRVASDTNPHLINMFRALQQGWIPPDYVSREEYVVAKNESIAPWLKAFIGFGCSFSGMWFRGYPTERRHNYALTAKKSLLKQIPSLQSVVFLSMDYRSMKPEGQLIYCDPPYRGATRNYDFVGKFDNDEFWNVMRKWSLVNTVIISEYQAPEDFACVWETNVPLTALAPEVGSTLEYRTEKLFILR